jgi:hypothetical protein
MTARLLPVGLLEMIWRHCTRHKRGFFIAYSPKIAKSQHRLMQVITQANDSGDGVFIGGNTSTTSTNQ